MAFINPLPLQMGILPFEPLLGLNTGAILAVDWPTYLHLSLAPNRLTGRMGTVCCNTAPT